MIRFNGYTEVNGEQRLDSMLWGSGKDFGNLSSEDKVLIFDNLNAEQHWLDIVLKQPDITKVTFTWWFPHRPQTSSTIQVINNEGVLGVFIPAAASPGRTVVVDTDNMTVIQQSGNQTYGIPMTSELLQQYEPYLRVAAAARGCLPYLGDDQGKLLRVTT